MNEIETLVKDDRVHRDVYTDPKIFALEMEQIFGRTWVYVGHESEVVNVGDFVTSFIGLQPVIVSRHTDGTIHVLHNRCGHRGAIVCNQDKGNTGKSFRCGYHGWTFRTNGELLAAPLKNGYPDCYDLAKNEFGLVPIKVANYRGFLFANAGDDSHGDCDISTHLGPMKACIDAICDRAPDGELDLSGGVQKYYLLGNWKTQIENLNDLYHPPYSHESTVNEKDGRQFVRRPGDGQGPQIIDSNLKRSIWDMIDIFAFDGGHSYCGPLNMGESVQTGDPVFDDYKSALLAKHSPERVAEILVEKFHNAIFYPNLNIQLLSNHIRVIRPIAVDRTEVRVYPVRLKGAPEEMFHAVVRYLNITHSPASLIQTDDLEMFRRIQVGMKSHGTDWVVFGRGFGQDVTEGNAARGFGTSELAMRNQYKAWRKYMCGAN
ncbi:aromatic ring-hydroxylating oxygenase subunit alpha [Paraburkholderia aspalathi]|uniref:aromatic ring-hydroxylating oxygenase subunit alpha n=1 Tax=Paraburkholderia aspalathi TaxID=1324617 RepID=UPI001B052DCF|nr:Rieske 2Fe-2S domain-containing protein [Paraburkholderia aspalathi]CAE6840860.1 2-halobenzoate 1,2-dioxygenase large subunit [Paraburkholderia aspalathi]